MVLKFKRFQVGVVAFCFELFALPEPTGSWIGQAVEICYVTLKDGMVLPRFRLIQ